MAVEWPFTQLGRRFFDGTLPRFARALERVATALEKGQPVTVKTGPWNDGSTARFEPWTNGHAVGFRCAVNGQTSYVYLNPSTGGDSQDVHVYQGGAGDPAEDAPLCRVGLPPPAEPEARRMDGEFYPAVEEK